MEYNHSQNWPEYYSSTLDVDQYDGKSSDDFSSEEIILACASRYEKQHILSDAICGSIWYAQDNVTGENVVIKECSIDSINRNIRAYGRGCCEDVFAEINTHQELCSGETRCPHIIELKGVWTDEKNVNLVLEYADGGDLFEHVLNSVNNLLVSWKNKGDTFSEELVQKKVHEWQKNVRRWICQLLVGLKYMHARNICHRDMSLENVALKGDETKDCKIIDFGMAHRFINGDFRSENTRLGKTAYMSPECYASKHYDARANDLWCVGVMMFICLTGANPWNSRSVHDVSHLVMHNGVRSLVRSYNREYLITDAAVDLLDNIFSAEERRISVDDALSHPFITGLFIDPAYDLDTWYNNSNAEDVVDGKLFVFQNLETVAGTSHVDDISVTEKFDEFSDICTSDNSCDLSIENVIYGEEVNDRVTAADSHPVKGSRDLFVLRDQETVTDFDDRIISQPEQTQVEELRHFRYLSAKSDIFDELDNHTVTAPVKEVLFGQLFDLGDEETVADTSDVQNWSPMELRDISTSANTLDSSSEYNLNADKVEDIVSAFSYSNITSIWSRGPSETHLFPTIVQKNVTLKHEREAREKYCRVLQDYNDVNLRYR